MPRNDQFIRQWLLLATLESTNGVSLKQLVDSLPDDYPKNPRTIRRDLEALEAAGVPLVTDQRNGRTSWRLIEGFRRLPALGFSPTELMSLVFSRNSLKPLEGTEIQASLNSALNKAAAALPPQSLDYVRQMEKFSLLVWDRTKVRRSGLVEIGFPYPVASAATRNLYLWHLDLCTCALSAYLQFITCP